MAVPETTVSYTLADENGVAAAGVTITARLDRVEKYIATSGSYSDTILVPTDITSVSDASGEGSLSLFPNELGCNGSNYVFSIEIPGQDPVQITGRVPSSNCDLTDVIPECANTITYKSFTDLTDTPASYSGHALAAITVKSDEASLEFTALPSTIGDTTGPSSAVDEDIPVFDGTGGKTIKDGGKTIAQVLDRANHTGTQTASTITTDTTNFNHNLSASDSDVQKALDTIDNFILAAGAGTGDVVGPGAATDEDIAIFDGATGKLIKDSGKKISDIGTGDVVGPAGATDGNYVKFDGATGKLIKDGGSMTIAPLHFIVQGTPTVQTKMIQALITSSKTVSKVSLYADTAPVGADLIVDINKNGTTIFTTQSHRPTITAGSNSGNTATIDVPNFVNGDRISVDIDQVGSTTVGGDDLLITVSF